MLIIKTQVLAIEQIKILKKELSYKTSRSGGKGGQNVNKVETKVEVAFDVTNSFALNEQQKQLVLSKIKSKLTDEGLLKLSEEKHRSQLANKEAVIEKLIRLLNKSLEIPTKRKPTKPTKTSKAKRREGKKHRSELKQSRKKLF